MKKIPRWEAVLGRMPSGPIRGVEVGVWQGSMSVELLRRSDLYLVMVDIVPRTMSLLKTELAKDRRVGIWLPSVKAAKTFADAEFDFVFIDADHTYEAVKADIIAWKPKVKPGGWLCGHDYGKPYKCGGVKRAVEELLPVHELDGDDTWFVKV
jgi:SAM-dependent methyltransferase